MDQQQLKTVRHGDVVWIGSKTFRFGTVVSYALEEPRPRDPIAALDRARQHGHPLAWANPRGAALAGNRAQAQAQAEWLNSLPRLSLGDLVRLEGRYYRLVPQPNDNVGLEPVEAPAGET